jgi:molybdopterin/thiamine biosynthesis adenylyltransferase
MTDTLQTLNDKETLRYSRHILLDEVGLDGQLMLKRSTVAVVGAGGLGSPALLYLAAAGIGSLILIDDDVVELSNLQRQVLYKVNHLGQNKVRAAGKVLASLNNQINIITHTQKLDDTNSALLCVFPQSSDAPVINCSNAGVISPLLGIVGSMQAQLTLNMLLGHFKGNVFITFDALSLKQQHFKMTKDLACKECGGYE